MEPFAEKYRPKDFSEIVGQQHLIGPDGVITKLLKMNYLPTMIFYGPPGCGKTTTVKIIADESGMECISLNATDIGVSDLKTAIDKGRKKSGIILYVDEFHLLNKKQQQSLLEATEKGYISLIAATTENPYFAIYKSILSRSSIFEFKPLTKEDIVCGIKNILNRVYNDYSISEYKIEDGVIETIAALSNGDLRNAINRIEMLFYSKFSNNKLEISLKDVEIISGKKILASDKDGDSHYDLLSALHKSLRGSDPNASLYYLGRLLSSGDIISIGRRLLCVASEDVGMADPMAVVITKSCVDSALQLGLPEARLPLAQAAIYLATAPKSNSVCLGIDRVLSDIENGEAPMVPPHLRDSHYNGAENLGHGIGYKYPHNYKNNWVLQQYLPSELVSRKYYKEQDNDNENRLKKFWDKIKNSIKS